MPGFFKQKNKKKLDETHYAKTILPTVLPTLESNASAVEKFACVAVAIAKTLEEHPELDEEKLILEFERIGKESAPPTHP